MVRPQHAIRDEPRHADLHCGTYRVPTAQIELMKETPAAGTDAAHSKWPGSGTSRWQLGCEATLAMDRCGRGAMSLVGHFRTHARNK